MDITEDIWKLGDAFAAFEGSGSVIGPYKLLQEIGQGGMGSVFMAEQERPVRRRVALKIIKLGMDTKAVIARFEAERQALAMMDHPNIAKVLDAGATKSGRPYFVMELIKGIPITEFCLRNKLNLQDRIRLFIPVCQAIQSAHQKGVIHRDIKPSNVLVTLDYGEPLAKVIDFGIAKATGQQLTEKTLFTQFGQMIGTPGYISPEQAENNSLNIDNRSDVYSLGALLYELLTGTTPISAKKLRDKSYLEVQKTIVEGNIDPPSVRLNGVDETERSDFLKGIGLDIRQTQRLLERDLDWVVMKCLEKERQLRFPSPGELADDLRRYLNGQATNTRPPSFLYRVQTLVRRYRLFTSKAGIRSSNSSFENRSSVDPLLQRLQETKRRISQVEQGMVKIPPGTFRMGSPLIEIDRGEEETEHPVTIGKPFWMGRYPVTQEEYEQIVGNNPSSFKGSHHPVESVTWDEAIQYCAILTSLARTAGSLPSGYEYRLPTEAQWEYACRAGTTTATAFGETLNSNQANFNGNYPYAETRKGPYLERTTSVGQYSPNAFGLYDMHGNIWEWCLDYLGPYPTGPAADPKGPPSGDIRVFRGGGWNDIGRRCRSADRNGNFPGLRFDDLGFRVVLVQTQ